MNETHRTLGFIILRYVNNMETNKYWNDCYECIRKFYPENHIMIIDDNSNQDYLLQTCDLYNTTIINSEYHKRGELLPYYYYLNNKLFDTAVIIHDSVFINKYIDFSCEKYKILWGFEHYWDDFENETKKLKIFNDIELLIFYENKALWTGCFGGMSVITHDYLTFINSKYEINKLLDVVINRGDRSNFERIIACLLQKEEGKKEVLFGNIHNYLPIGLTYNEKDKYSHLSIVKVWTGR